MSPKVQLDSLFDVIPSPIFVVKWTRDGAFYFERVNESLQRELGIGEKIAPRAMLRDVFEDSLASRWQHALERALQVEGGYEQEIRGKDDGLCWYLRLKPICDDGREFTAILGSVVRKPSEQRLAETCCTNPLDSSQEQSLLQSILHHAPIGIWVVDEQQRPLLVNRHFYEKTGFGRENPSLTPSEIATCRSTDVRVLREGRSLAFEERITYLDGNQHTLQTIKTPIETFDGRVAVLGLGVDITEKKAAENVSAQLLREQQLLLDNIDIPIWYVSHHDHDAYTRANRAFSEFFGLGEQDARDGAFATILASQALDTHVEHNRQAFANGENLRTEEWVTDYRSRRRLLSVDRNPILDVAGRVERLVCSAVDITDQRRMEERLRRREAQFKALAENSPDLITRVDRAFRRLYTNPQVERVFAVDQDEAIGKTNRELGVDAEITALWEETLHQVFATGEPRTREWPVCSTDGTRYFHTRLVPEFDARGEVESVLSISRDITAFKETQWALRSSEEKYRALIEQSGEMLFLHDTEGRILEVNAATINQTGYTREELLNMEVFDIHAAPSRHQEMIGAWRSWSLNDPPLVLESEHVHKSGAVVPVEVSSRKISFGGGEYIMALVRDITERKRVEEEIRYRSFHDSLTGLYNRHFLEEEMMWLDVDRQLPISLMMVDLNGLKLVNDTYGHHRGDQMLQKTAEILEDCCRAEDIIGRWGGDEFVVVLPDTGSEDAERIHRRIRHACEDAFLGPIPISMTVGTATKESPGYGLLQYLTEAENQMYRLKLGESRSQKSAVIHALLRTLSEKSYETETHTNRMKDIALKIGRDAGLGQAELRQLDLVVQLHDIGKIKVPERILMKTDPLSKEEWEIVRAHPESGYRIARSTEEFAHVAEEILAHHEWWDGSGYPRGLRGDQIPLLARIVAIADAYEAMTKGRSYRAPVSHEEAIAELVRHSGTQFDPALTDIAVRVLQQEPASRFEQ